MALGRLIGFITNAALFGDLRWGAPPSFTDLDAEPRLVVVAVAGALVVSVLALWAPVIGGHGIPEAMEAVLVRQSRISPRAAVAKPLSTAVSIGTGCPTSPTCPIIVTGGALGSLIGQVIRVSPSERKILLACGAASGMAATFCAPLAAVVLAIELLLFEMSSRAFVPLVVAAAVAGGMHALLFEAGPFFAVPDHRFAGIATLPACAGRGVLCGAAAVVIAKGAVRPRAGLPAPAGERLLAPSAGSAGVRGRRAGRPSGARGRLRRHHRCPDRPAHGRHGRRPGSGQAVGLVDRAGIGHVGRHAGAAAADRRRPRQPLRPRRRVGLPRHPVEPGGVRPGRHGRGVRIGHPGAVHRHRVRVRVRADRRLPGDPAADAGHRAGRPGGRRLPGRQPDDREAHAAGAPRPHHYEVDPLRTRLARQIMSSPVETLPASATVALARERLVTGRHGAYPLVDGDGRCVGVVARGDLMAAAADLDEDAPVLDHASRDVVAVAPGDPGIAALQTMSEHVVDHLPVVDGEGRCVGVITRTDLLRASSSRFDHERPQPGWRPTARAPTALLSD